MTLRSGSSSIVNAILFEDCGAPDLPNRACRCSDRLLSAFRRRSRLGGKSTIFSCGLLHRLFEATPPTLLAGDESVGFRRTAAPSRIVRERWRRQSRPCFFDGRDDGALRFHFISAREERSVTTHGVEQ